MYFNKVIKAVHTYIGLQSVLALLLFSVTVIAVSIKSDQEVELTHYQFEGDTSLPNIELAKLLRKQVGFRFEPVPQSWMVSEAKVGRLVVRLKSPAAKRQIILNKVNGNIEIKSRPLTFSHFADYMHQESFGRRKASDSLWLWAWSLYIEFSILALFALPVTGLYIWVSKKSPKQLWAKLSLIFSLTSMVLLWTLIR
jgi:hypothetical protein